MGLTHIKVGIANPATPKQTIEVMFLDVKSRVFFIWPRVEMPLIGVHDGV